MVLGKRSSSSSSSATAAKDQKPYTASDVPPVSKVKRYSWHLAGLIALRIYEVPHEFLCPFDPNSLTKSGDGADEPSRRYSFPFEPYTASIPNFRISDTDVPTYTVSLQPLKSTRILSKGDPSGSRGDAINARPLMESVKEKALNKTTTHTISPTEVSLLQSNPRSSTEMIRPADKSFWTHTRDVQGFDGQTYRWKENWEKSVLNFTRLSDGKPIAVLSRNWGWSHIGELVTTDGIDESLLYLIILTGYQIYRNVSEER